MRARRRTFWVTVVGAALFGLCALGLAVDVVVTGNNYALGGLAIGCLLLLGAGCGVQARRLHRQMRDEPHAWG